jgi:hypothetical protein
MNVVLSVNILKYIYEHITTVKIYYYHLKF